MERSFGWLLVGVGVLLVIAGALWMTGALSWIGRLPGDVRVERPGLRVYVPVVSMVVISLALTLVLWLIGMLRR